MLESAQVYYKCRCVFLSVKLLLFATGKNLKVSNQLQNGEYFFKNKIILIFLYKSYDIHVRSSVFGGQLKRQLQLQQNIFKNER